MKPAGEVTKKEAVEVEETPELGDVGGDGGDGEETDPLFIQCDSEAVEAAPSGPAVTEKLPLSSAAEEEALDDPDAVEGEDEVEEKEACVGVWVERVLEGVVVCKPSVEVL